MLVEGGTFEKFERKARSKISARGVGDGAASAGLGNYMPSVKQAEEHLKQIIVIPRPPVYTDSALFIKPKCVCTLI